MEGVIPPKKSRKEAREYKKHLYAFRHLAENASLQFEAMAGYCYAVCKKMPRPLLPRRKFAASLFGLTSCDDTI